MRHELFLIKIKTRFNLCANTLTALTRSQMLQTGGEITAIIGCSKDQF